MIIRKLRLDKGLSQEQLADMAGVSTRTLQRIERGAKASPETLKCLAAVLEVDFATLREEQTMMTETTPNDTFSQQPASPAQAVNQAHPQTAATELSDEERMAMEYVRDIKSFYTHAMQYALVMVLLLIVNLVTSPDYFWVIWPAMGWGIGLLTHGLSVFEVINIFGDNWERRQIERRMRRRN